MTYRAGILEPLLLRPRFRRVTLRTLEHLEPVTPTPRFHGARRQRPSSSVTQRTLEPPEPAEPVKSKLRVFHRT
jgi:hypothetical protein